MFTGRRSELTLVSSPPKHLVQQFYDEAAAARDRTKDAWAVHCYTALRQILRNTFSDLRPGNRVLDVGCGIGIHTSFLSNMGGGLIGIDLSTRSVRLANHRITVKAQQAICLPGDAERLPFRDATFDAVCCLGSVLNYVHNYRRAIAELCRVVRPNGVLVIHVDNRVCFDFFWVLLNRVLFNLLNYQMTIRDAVRMSSGSLNGGLHPYPHSVNGHKWKHIPMRLISFGDLRSALIEEDAEIEKCFGVHVLTSLVPYTIASDRMATGRTTEVVNFLASLDSVLKEKIPFNRISAELCVVARRLP